METFKERLIACREAAGLTQSELARRLSLTPQAVQKWEKGENVPRGKRMEKLASLLSTSVGYLLIGEGSANVEPGPRVSGVLPLISWVRAGQWTEALDIAHPMDEGVEMIPCPSQHSSRAFALRVRGESMFNPGSRRSFLDGELIYVDPERDAVNGSLVIAKLDDSEETTFKELVIEGDRCFLKALNPDWPNRIFEVGCDVKIIGVVFGKYLEV